MRTRIKSLKKLPLFVVLFAVSLACSQEDSSMDDSNADLIRSSIPFKSLAVSEQLLDFENIEQEITASGHVLLIVSFNDVHVPKKIVNALDENHEVLMSTLVEVESSIDPGDFVTFFEQNKFMGRLSMLSSTGWYFGFDFKDSRLINMFVGADNDSKSPNASSAKLDACNGWTKSGGPMDCAGASLVNEGPFSKASCYSSFIPCMIFKALDCVLNGCVMLRSPGPVVVDGKEYSTNRDPLKPEASIKPVVKPKEVINIDPAIFK